ncbi:pyrroline-5-carboxylate reductase [Caulobacter ginsengisoli]|uniref:pyrroline-5-carboxylate reductase n=1 Tax=Caulobacter ginsengisoli TaxID=400775 RepID=UPI0027D87D99|nr:pyrroline-5-carboxylate reductase [Caulobacter ginsengisoli]
MTPILLLGAGRMGGALISGWRSAGTFKDADLMVRDPHPGPEAAVLAQPDDAGLAQAKTVLLAVKPQLWRAAAAIAPHLAPDAVIVSIAAGVGLNDIAQAFGGRRVARVMPNTAVAINQGVASLYAPDPEARARAEAMFAPVAKVVPLESEDLMHAATAVAGSGPAYLYAFVEALAAAGLEAGLTAEAASDMARSMVIGSAALMARSDEDPAELRRQVTSPGGTTQAALEVLTPPLGPLMTDAVAAAVRRSRELG